MRCSKYLILFVYLIVGSMVVPGRAAVAPSSLELLETVENARQALFTLEASGDGIAVGKGVYQIWKQRASQTDDSTQIRFRYSPTNCLAGIFLSKAEPDPTLYTLVAGAKQFTYSKLANSLNVTAVRTSDASLEPQYWSVQQLSAIPMFQDDVQLFGYLKKPPADINETITEQGSCVNVSVNRHAPNKLRDLQQELNITFDLSLAGMLTSYSFSDDTVQGGERDTYASRLVINWTARGPLILPKTRQVDVNSNRHGKITKNTSSITFTQFNIEPQLGDNLSLSSLHIKNGTIVMDSTTGVNGKFSSGFFSASVPTTKNTN
jgi:hypothetical protein